MQLLSDALDDFDEPCSRVGLVHGADNSRLTMIDEPDNNQQGERKRVHQLVGRREMLSTPVSSSYVGQREMLSTLVSSSYIPFTGTDKRQPDGENTSLRSPVTRGMEHERYAPIHNQLSDRDDAVHHFGYTRPSGPVSEVSAQDVLTLFQDDDSCHEPCSRVRLVHDGTLFQDDDSCHGPCSRVGLVHDGKTDPTSPNSFALWGHRSLTNRCADFATGGAVPFAGYSFPGRPPGPDVMFQPHVRRWQMMMRARVGIDLSKSWADQVEDEEMMWHLCVQAELFNPLRSRGRAA